MIFLLYGAFLVITILTIGILIGFSKDRMLIRSGRKMPDNPRDLLSKYSYEKDKSYKESLSSFEENYDYDPYDSDYNFDEDLESLEPKDREPERCPFCKSTYVFRCGYCGNHACLKHCQYLGDLIYQCSNCAN